nr:hypothetical protein [Bacteroidota bacterium]
MKEFILKRLRLPEYNEDIDLDDPKVTEMRMGIILRKPFLRKLYTDWYNIFIKKLKGVPEGKIIEIGSGGGFLKEMLPEVITSDVMPLSCNDMAFSA